MPFCIAMVCDFFHPNVGGVENHIYHLAAHLIALGHKLIVLTHAHPPRTGIRHLLPHLKIYHLPLLPLAASATLPNFFCFLPYFREICIREGVQIVHGHAALSSLALEAVMHAHLVGCRTVFTDHSLFGFDDATGILTNKLLAGALRSVDAVICVSHTGRENTVLRAQLPPHKAHVIPNAVVPAQFQPSSTPSPPSAQNKQITIAVISRLVYRKGIDLLLTSAPRICRLHPSAHFLIAGSGPKTLPLLQMRETHALQDRITLLGAVKHSEVRGVLARAQVFLNTSLTEAFGIGILEAACAGLKVVSTRVGGVPEVLPPDMVEFANPDEDDVVRALSRAIRAVESGAHDPLRAHERVKDLYAWSDIAARTAAVYDSVLATPPYTLYERLCRTLTLGPFAGPIFAIILIVDCLFFAVLEWVRPRAEIELVRREWDRGRWEKMCEKEERRWRKESGKEGRTQEEADPDPPAHSTDPAVHLSSEV